MVYYWKDSISKFRQLYVMSLLRNLVTGSVTFDHVMWFKLQRFFNSIELFKWGDGIISVFWSNYTFRGEGLRYLLELII